MQAPTATTGQQKQLSVPHTSDVEAVGNELFDGECLKLINEYFYGNVVFACNLAFKKITNGLKVFAFFLVKTQLMFM